MAASEVIHALTRPVRRLVVPGWLTVAALASLALPVWLPVAVMLYEAQRADVSSLVRDGRLGLLLGRSLAVAGGTAGLAVLLGLPLALALARLRLPGASWLKMGLVLPLLVPPYISAIGWLHLLGRSGALNGWLTDLLGLGGPPIDLYTVGGTVWVLGLSLFPVVALPALAALDSIDPDLEEAARLAGGRWAGLWYITLPLIAPAVLAGALLVFLLALTEFTVPSFLSVQVYTVEVFTRFGAFYDFGAGTAMAVPLLALALAAFAGQRLLAEHRAGSPFEASAASRQLPPAGWWAWPVAAWCLALPLLAWAVPLYALAGRAPTPDDFALAWEAAQTEIINSLLFAAAGAGLGLLAGWPVAWVVVRARTGLGRSLTEALALLPLAVPSIVLGIGLIRLWNRGGLFQWVYGSPAIILLGYVARSLPFVVVVLVAAWRQIPPVFEEAAEVDGASRRQSARWVILPLLWPGLAAAWSLAFVVAVTELPTTLLVYPPGQATLPVRIFTMQHDGRVEHVAALCLILVAITVLPAGVAWIWSQRREAV